jgi:hypothetical protein
MAWEEPWWINYVRAQGPIKGREVIYRGVDAAFDENDAFDFSYPFPVPREEFLSVIVDHPGHTLTSDLPGLMPAHGGTRQYIVEMDNRMGILSFRGSYGHGKFMFGIFRGFKWGFVRHYRRIDI